jgi:hypothetical protein
VAATAGELRAAGVKFRSEIVDGIGTRQVMIEDPSGNPVELFEPKRAEARLSGRLPHRSLQQGPDEAALEDEEYEQ